MSTAQALTRADADHPQTPGHLATCDLCQCTLLAAHNGGDHRRCHLDSWLECEVSARWLEPVREAARAALAGHPSATVAVVSRGVGVEEEPTVHGVGSPGADVRRVFWDAKRRLGLPTDLALHGVLFYVHPDDEHLPLR